ncbi:MAG: UbiA family prenyltransferase [Candidatus Sungbacteria bacterium]|uniref:UbiA family prenyltransferase n=1 Tax=Candidatus Sungiibacteriota bacterium TaxID=2750080 RepID=A0A931SCZ3_9BACT|nr:UbiA family prenyltransferase [Candidatus Sungbacteria bacterium]
MSGVRPLWSAVIATLLIACATMLQNDWRDRSHDIRKGKTLAIRHPQSFLTLVVATWGISVVLSATVAMESWQIGSLLFGAILIGLVHPETRMIPMVPILLAAVVSASPALMAILAGAESWKLWLVFLSSAFVVFGREIIKDLDDLRIDGGYKWTIPLVMGERRAKLVAVATVAMGSVIALGITAVTLPGVVLALVGAFFLLRHNERQTAKYCIDLGMAFAIVALGIWG